MIFKWNMDVITHLLFRYKFVCHILRSLHLGRKPTRVNIIIIIIIISSSSSSSSINKGKFIPGH
jgi:hypothetical protein